jgi:amino acid adenylation domain-containing protein
LTIQYRDYACWQRESLQGEKLDSHLRFWKDLLQGNPEPTELPADHPRPSRPNCRGACRWRALDAGTVAGLKQLAQRARVTPFIVLLTAFKALLHRYTQQEDILIGSPMTGRSQLETEDLIGLFVNTLPLRTRITGEEPFSELLARVRTLVFDAFSHQDLPFEKLVGEVRPERSLNATPLVRIMFQAQNAPVQRQALPGLELEFLETGVGEAKIDLLLTITETPQNTLAFAQYNAELFEEDTIARLLEHYEILLQAISTRPEQRISELPLMSEAERRRVLVEWNQTSTDFPRGKCLHELFEEQARRTPHTPAVEFGRGQLTYAELNARADQLAHYLRQRGIQPGARVGVYLERSLEMPVGLLGILKADAAYAALDARSPRERLADMLEDLQPQLVLTQQRLANGLPDMTRLPRPPDILSLDGDWKQIVKQPATDLCTESAPEDVAYISFTSGSTGRPKGVCVPHRGIVRLVKNTNFASFSADEVFLHLSPIAFDASLFEIWGPLLNGGRVVIAPPELASLSDLGEIIREHGVTTAWFTSGLFNQMIDEAPEAVLPLRQIVTGGDVLSPQHARRALSLLPRTRLINAYGPTENSTFTTSYEVPRAFDGNSAAPIGKPISNTECYILDHRLRPVPIGVPGELCTGGDGLAAGYLNRPRLTAERFVPNPFEPGTCLYRTGDWTRFRPEGNIEFLGRMDQQVKIRGFRIELGEIETRLLQHPAVLQCVVVPRNHSAGGKQLAAYFVPNGKPTPSAQELQLFLRERLPDYMVPAFFTTLDELPLSPNGKVQHSALPEPRVSTGGSAEDRCADETQRKLQGLWESVLGVSGIGAQDQFFALGGHSLLAVRLVARIEKVLGKKLPVAAVFQNPTIAQMARLLRKPTSERRSSIVEIQPRGSRPPLMLVHGAGGGMFWGYSNLARHLGADQPMFAFNSRGLVGLEEPETVESLAESYLADLRVFQRHGPYYLGGYCFGGLIAYEMARRLHEHGERIGLLALINSMPPNSRYVSFHWSPVTSLKFAWNFLRKATYCLPLPFDRLAKILRWKGRLLARRWQPAAPPYQRCAPSSYDDAEYYLDMSDYPEDQRRLWNTHIKALTAYRPLVSGLRAMLFRSPLHLLRCSFDSKYGWGEFARGGVDLRIVPGAHDTIMEEPRVRRLGAELSSALALAFRQEAEESGGWKTPASS